MPESFLNTNLNTNLFNPKLTNQAIILILILIWILVWKGIALWKSARNGHKKWFIIFFAINSFAILEIIYLFIFAKPKSADKKKKENT